MTNTVTLCENTFDPSTWETFENVEDVREFLVDHFGIWPESAHIYLDHVANNADITPYDTAGIERLGKVQGHFFVVVYPEGIEVILLIVALVIAAVSIALVFLFRPSIGKNQQEASANNKLGDRQNTARPNERIPDIFGELWATFDLLAVPYRTFVDNQEIEHCYMCIGRGYYDIKTVRDDITPIDQIDGCSAEIYFPFNSPNLGGAGADITLGPPIGERVFNVQVFGSVNGQILPPPNLNTVLGGNNIRFHYSDIIEANGGVNFTDHFTPTDTLTIGGLFTDDDLAVDSAGLQPSVHLNGSYAIINVFPTQIFLDTPATINPNWNALSSFGGNVSTYRSIDLIANNDFQAGPFVILNKEMDAVWLNFVCNQGCYLIDKDGNQHAWSVSLQVGVRPCDISGAPTGGAELFYTATIQGNHTDRQSKGVTLKINLGSMPAAGGIIIRAKRTSNTDLTAGRTIVDETQWRDCYIVSNVPNNNFGNVTTVQTLTKPTPRATAIKNRKMNALVTRKIPELVGGVFTGLVASKNAADILCAMALDPFIGNRTLAELDVAGIYALAGTGVNKVVLNLDGVALDQGVISCPEPATLPRPPGKAWQWEHDPGTPGTSCGNSSLITVYSHSGQSRRFDVSFTPFGGERFHIYLGPGDLDYASDTFEYDIWFSSNDLTHINQLEFDMNQVDSAGKTIIFGVQANFATGKWQVTSNLSGAAHWNDTTIAVSRWSANVFHHLVFKYHRDNAGNVTYDSITLDATTNLVGLTFFSQFSLGWTPNGTLLMNIQINGDNSTNSVVCHGDDMTLRRKTTIANGEIEKYFAVQDYPSAVTEFCYTFDDSKVSFEEAVATLAQAIFCVAYRRGSLLTLSFEKQTDNSTILFNHRNKIPRSETRTVSFGTVNDNDGITLDYINPIAPNYPNLDTTSTLYFPTNQSAVNPKKVTAIGVRNLQQATLLGWRLYRKLIFQNTVVQFDGTEEAALLVLQDRILVADNTRSDTQDGDVTNQVSLLLTLSQNVELDADFNYTIFIQHPDATVEAIPITAGGSPNQVILAYAPTVPCVFDPALFAKTTYMIVSDAPQRQNAFLLSEKTPKDNKTYECKGVNYDNSYYSHDKDYAINLFLDSFYVEVMQGPAPPNTEIDGLYVEAMKVSPAPNLDVDGLYIEVMKH